MKTQILILSGILSILLVTSSRATTVSFSVGPTSKTVNNEAGSVLIQTSSSFWIGTFASEGAIAGVVDNLQSVAANIALITAAGGWEQFTMDATTGLLNAGATSTLDISAGATPGRLSGSATDTNTGATKADFFNGDPIYVWVFNAETPATATEMGIFRAPSAATAWTFPTNTGGLGDDVALSTASSVVINAIGGVGSISGSQLRTEGFGVIPEPSRLMLLGMAGLGVFFRRRRC